MEKIQEEIKKYITCNWVRKLQKEAKVWASVIYSILNNEEKKYYPEKLENIYNFFWLQKDNFFKKKVFKFKLYNPLWKIFFLRRKKLWFSENFVAKKIKWSVRHLKRIESWDLKTYDSFYIKEILELYNFSPLEKQKILNYLKSLKNILDIEK